MALYTDLPGVDLTIKDGNLVLPAEPTGTQRVLIIAPTTEAGLAAPAELSIAPIRIKGSEDFARYTLGVFSPENPLARKWKQVFDAGCRDIYVLQLFGTTPELKYAYLHEIFTVIGDFDADIVLLDGVKVDTAITTASVTITNGVDDFMEIGGTAELVKTLVEETVTGIEVAVIDLAGPIVGQVTVVKNGNALGVDDFAVDKISGTLTLTVPAILGDTFDITYYSYAYSFAGQLAGFCAQATKENDQVIGIMSVTAPTSQSLSAVKTFVDSKLTQKQNQFLQVVCGPTMMFEMNNTPYADDFSGAYAGLVSILPSYSSPTNKVLPGALWQQFSLSPNQIKDLTNKHFVVPRVRNGRIVISDAVTTAPDKSDFVRLSTVRITNDAVNLVREICEPYIGEPNTLARRNALETQIDTALQGMIKRGALNDYRFSVKASLSDQMDGNLRIALDLVPVFETRRIFITVALKPSL